MKTANYKISRYARNDNTYLIRVLLVLVLTTNLLSACSDKNETASLEEIYQPDEASLSKKAVANFEQLLEDYKTTYVTRGAHAKAHACVRAWFNVNHYIEPSLRHGIFVRPGQQFKSWIRFSNGHFDLSVSKDQKSDARGMAVKILEPPGEPLQIAANHVATQDFLMTNSPVFFVENIHDYNDLVAEPAALLGFIFPSWNPATWRLREMSLAKKTLTPPPVSLLAPQYFSITAYKLGPHNIKFSARPCAGQEINSVVNETDPDFLRNNLQEELEAGEACFDFMVQLQNPEKNMSIEDPTVEWKESDSPFIPMARITIPAQSFGIPEQMAFCENLSFAPWHALPEHRPIGQFNRIRQQVYPASSNYRHSHNQTQIPVDIAW